MKRVKINSKMAMLLAMFAMIFTFNACDGGGGSDDDGNSSAGGGGDSSSSGGGDDGNNSSSSVVDIGGDGTTKEKAISLTQGTFKEGEIISSNSAVWYKFNVTEGTIYEVNLLDNWYDEEYTLKEWAIEAYYSNGANFDWVATSSGTVYVKAFSYRGNSIGTFRIAYFEYEECYDCYYGAPQAAPKANVLSKLSKAPKISKKK